MYTILYIKLCIIYTHTYKHTYLHVHTDMWKGLGSRILMVGTLTAMQWFIYDWVKVALRMPRPPPPQMPESLKSTSSSA